MKASKQRKIARAVVSNKARKNSDKFLITAKQETAFNSRRQKKLLFVTIDGTQYVY